jgi:hypothetical protein
MLNLSSSQSESSLFSPYEKDSDIGKALPTLTKLGQPGATEGEGTGLSSPVPGIFLVSHTLIYFEVEYIHLNIIYRLLVLDFIKYLIMIVMLQHLSIIIFI